MKCGAQRRLVVCGGRTGAWSAILSIFALLACNSPASPLRALEAQADPVSSHQIHVGQTIDEVIIALGKPDVIVDLESRVIYVYRGRKIIFANGRVTDPGSGETLNEPRELTQLANPVESFRDGFSRDSAPNSEFWSTDTALLKALASSISSPASSWVTPRIDFTASGLRISGVSGPNQFTGVQSNRCFNAPFTVKAAVAGQIAHGNAFELFLVTGDLQELINLDGNLDPSSGYRGLWENVRQDGSSRPGDRVFDAPATNTWYDIVVTIDSAGNASVTVSTAEGAQLVSRQIPGIGTGPFWVILAQREGQPFVVGPNEATWREVSITSETGAPARQPFGPVSGRQRQSEAPRDH
jgi:hypothetical protein